MPLQRLFFCSDYLLAFAVKKALGYVGTNPVGDNLIACFQKGLAQ
jgi:hypothetical protein